MNFCIVDECGTYINSMAAKALSTIWQFFLFRINKKIIIDDKCRKTRSAIIPILFRAPRLSSLGQRCQPWGRGSTLSVSRPPLAQLDSVLPNEIRVHEFWKSNFIEHQQI